MSMFVEPHVPHVHPVRALSRVHKINATQLRRINNVGVRQGRRTGWLEPAPVAMLQLVRGIYAINTIASNLCIGVPYIRWQRLH